MVGDWKIKLHGWMKYNRGGTEDGWGNECFSAKRTDHALR